MGQSKQRLRRMQQEQPWCVYCGGTTPGTSVDHMPPIAIFDNRDRPKGMEYLACETCHNGSRALDQLASLLSRAYPDPHTPHAQHEAREHFRGIGNNFPMLLREMKPSPEQEERARKARDTLPGSRGALAIGPVMRTLLMKFAGRVGLALHYELCRQIVPVSGGVFGQVYTNASLLDGKFPSNFLGMLGDPKTLRQGSKSVESQFSYASKALEDLSMSAHMATFRMSFAVQAFVARDATDLPPPPELGDVDVTNRIFRPGFLK